LAKALEGIRALEYGSGLAGTLCGRLLSELGAEVVKLEPPRGDPVRRQRPLDPNGISYAFLLANSNKKSVVLDLRDPQGIRDLARLASAADILIEHDADIPLNKINFPEPAGTLGYPALGLLNPRLVYCLISPYGNSGPLAGKPASELTIQAMSGQMAITGFPADPPTRSGPSIANLAGAAFGALAILAALVRRETTKEGEAIDLSLHDCMVSFLSTFLPECFVSGKAVPRRGNRHPFSTPWNAYRTLDGWVLICTSTQPHWENLLKAIGREDLIGNPRYDSMPKRREREEEVDGIIEEWTSIRSSSEVVWELEKARIVAGPVLPIDKLLVDEHFLSHGMVAPAGNRSITIGSVLNGMSETPGSVYRPAPSLGEHTSEVLSALPSDPPVSAAALVSRYQNSLSHALEGFRVLDLGNRTAGAYATKLLALLGAETIKIEPLEGEHNRELHPMVKGTGYMHLLHSVNKKSVTLDLKKARGRELFLELAAKADVLLENMAPGAMERLGLGYHSVRETNPTMVYCSIKGFGQKGPYRDRGAMDTILQAMAGIMSTTGWPDGPPTKIGASIVDLMGACFAALGVLAALYHRQKGGQGQLIDLSMHDVAGWIVQEAWAFYLGTGQPPPRTGNRHPIRCPQNTYRAKDGLVAIAVEREEQWPSLLKAMGRADLLISDRYNSTEKRVELADEVDGIVTEWVSNKSVAEITQVCDKFGVPSGLVLEVHEVVSHPQTIYRRMVVACPDGDGDPIKTSGSPFWTLQATPEPLVLAPSLGQHNQECLGKLLGYTLEELDRLQRDQVIV